MSRTFKVKILRQANPTDGAHWEVFELAYEGGMNMTTVLQRIAARPVTQQDQKRTGSKLGRPCGPSEGGDGMVQGLQEEERQVAQDDDCHPQGRQDRLELRAGRYEPHTAEAANLRSQGRGDHRESVA